MSSSSSILDHIAPLFIHVQALPLLSCNINVGCLLLKNKVSKVKNILLNEALGSFIFD